MRDVSHISYYIRTTASEPPTTPPVMPAVPESASLALFGDQPAGSRLYPPAPRQRSERAQQSQVMRGGSASACRTQRRSVSAVEPIAAQCEPCFPASSSTGRSTRSPVGASGKPDAVQNGQAPPMRTQRGGPGLGRRRQLCYYDLATQVKSSAQL